MMQIAVRDRIQYLLDKAPKTAETLKGLVNAAPDTSVMRTAELIIEGGRWTLPLLNIFPPTSYEDPSPDVSFFHMVSDIAAESPSVLTSMIDSKNIIGFEEYPMNAGIIAQDALFLINAYTRKGESIQAFQGTNSFKLEMGILQCLSKIQIEQKSALQLVELRKSHAKTSLTSDVYKLNRDVALYVTSTLCKWQLVKDQECAEEIMVTLRHRLSQLVQNRNEGAVMKVLFRIFAVPLSTVDAKKGVSASSINRILSDYEHLIINIPNDRPPPTKPPQIGGGGGKDTKKGDKDSTKDRKGDKRGNKEDGSKDGPKNGDKWADPRKGGINWCANKLLKGTCYLEDRGHECHFRHDIPEEIKKAFRLPDGTTDICRRDGALKKS